MIRLRILLTLVLLFLSLPTVLFAQNGSISGTVADPTGAVVQGAEIDVRSLATNALRTTTSNATGAYFVADLPVGAYEVTITKGGFRTFRLSTVELTVAQALTVNATLQPGAASESVEVEADQLPDVDLETSQISNLVNERQMQDLPLITRDPYSLVLLSPGTSQTDSSTGGFSVNGARDRNNNFLLDGVDNNDTSVPGSPYGILAANPDSTEEFRVITDNFNAEFGRNTGAIIDVVTKSGTNTFRGDAYEYGRWNGFGGARDWFNPAIVNGEPSRMNPYVRNQFGFSLGGPIIKNKTFFFANLEMDRFRTTLTNQSTVPTAAFKTGVFTYTDSTGTRTPVNLLPGSSQNETGAPLDPTMQKVFALYPNPTTPSVDGIEGSIFFPSRSAFNAYNATFKIDHHINDRELLTLRYAYNWNADPNAFHNDFLPGGVGSVGAKGIDEGVAAQLTSTLRNDLVNNFQFGWNHAYGRFYVGGLNVLDSPGGLDQYGNGRDYLMDPFTSFGSINLGYSDNQARETGTVSYTDNITWVHGNNTFKFGFDFRNVGETGFDDFSSRRQFNMETELLFGFDPGLIQNIPNPSTALLDATDALYGLVIEDNAAQFFNKAGVRQPTDNKSYRQHEFDWYGQDTWKLRTNLTLSLGLRYQLNGVPYEENGNASNLLRDPGSFAAGQTVTFSVVGPGTGLNLYHQDYKDIEPRIGLSWDPWRDGKNCRASRIWYFP